ncbi:MULTISPECIES: type VI secretion system protein TssA [Acidiphilium]|uniref:type VI secretion system protein TssA n=1 Tax=Acidiphilium TaxID=522 RepID=UPI0004619591|nr:MULTISPECIES: type VI secretion system protein TssA [Acidiphilium]KDM68514.1 type VI secretion system family protein [Acidiphilium sp. JA12-A1]MBS3023381.1 type VI secretion system protein TssA [Acidiphilium multivorum]MDE2328091.1 type VI secretion system protein TssA [Rhodospirillales bacterium]
MILDIDALLAPIEGDSPVGQDLRADYTAGSIYYRLRDARSDARAAERAADSDPTLEADAGQHWRSVLQLAQTALGKSHDLEVAAWMTEAMVRENGLAGLAEGARLMAGLVHGFWEALYPLPDEDGMETRVAPVAGLNGTGSDGTLIQPLRKLTLFNAADGSPVPVFLYLQAEETAGLGDEKRKAARIAAGVPAFAQLETQARVAGTGHFTALARGAAAALEAWQAMGAAFDEVAGYDAPPTSRVREVLEQIIAISQRYAPGALAAPGGAAENADAAAGAEAAGAAEDAVAVDGPAPAQAAKKPYTREDALRQLGEIAEFFRRTEPQSPIALTLDEAIRRARLTWPELIEDILADAGVRQAMLTALGIKPPAD